MLNLVEKFTDVKSGRKFTHAKSGRKVHAWWSRFFHFVKSSQEGLYKKQIKLLRLLSLTALIANLVDSGCDA